MDTLLIIAVKVDNAELASLILGLDGVDVTRKNGKGLDAMAVAKALGREHLLLGMATTSVSDAVEPSVKGRGAAAAAGDGDGDGDGVATKLGALPPPPGTTAGEVAAGPEVAQLGYAVEMLKVMTISYFQTEQTRTLLEICDDALSVTYLSRVVRIDL